MEAQDRMPTAEVAPAWGAWIGRALAALTAMMCLYLGVTTWVARGDLLHALTQLPVGALPRVLLLVAAGFALRACRWQYYVRRLRWRIPLLHSQIAFFASFAFAATPGKMGEVVKSLMLRARHQVPLEEGVAVLVVERLGDLLAVLLLACGGLTLLADGRWYFAISGLLVGAMTVFVCCRSVYVPVLGAIARLPRLAGPAKTVLRLLDTGRALLKPRPFLAGHALALLAWGCEALAFHCLMRGFGMPLAVTTSFSIYGIATLVGALSALPGGLGCFEVVMVMLLTRLGTPAATATVPVLLFRFCTLWLGSALGLVAVLCWVFFFATSNAAAVSPQLPLSLSQEVGP